MREIWWVVWNEKADADGCVNAKLTAVDRAIIDKTLAAITSFPGLDHAKPTNSDGWIALRSTQTSKEKLSVVKPNFFHATGSRTRNQHAPVLAIIYQGQLPRNFYGMQGQQVIDSRRVCWQPHNVRRNLITAPHQLQSRSEGHSEERQNQPNADASRRSTRKYRCDLHLTSRSSPPGDSCFFMALTIGFLILFIEASFFMSSVKATVDRVSRNYKKLALHHRCQDSTATAYLE